MLFWNLTEQGALHFLEDGTLEVEITPNTLGNWKETRSCIYEHKNEWAMLM